MTPLSRREREIMDALHGLGEADVEQVRERLPDPPGYDSVRTILRILETKGHVRRQTAGKRHVYRPVQARAAALKEGWESLVRTFFQGSHEVAAATLLKASDPDLDEAALSKLLADIEQTTPQDGGGDDR